jgi:predicted methyltransferase MtxX (methanogen marker protein 4)
MNNDERLLFRIEGYKNTITFRTVQLVLDCTSYTPSLLQVNFNSDDTYRNEVNLTARQYKLKVMVHNLLSFFRIEKHETTII